MNESKQVYSHFTCATNTDNVKFVFNVVMEVVNANNLRAGGMV